MNINFNISPSLVRRLVDALERFASDYADVHRDELKNIRYSDLPIDKSVGHTYYQDDKALYEAELKEKQRRAEEYGNDA